MACTPEFLADFARTVSRARLFRYLVAAKQDFDLALSLYEKNVLLSQAIFGFLQGVEVSVRNSIHHVLSQDPNKLNWIQDNLPLPWPVPAPTHLTLTLPMLDMLTQAQRKTGMNASVGKLIAELNFGFWADLIGSRYEHIWRNSLHKAFPHAQVPRNRVHWRLESIRHLRNRIAHHEPIITSTNTVRTGRFDETHLTLDSLVERVKWISPPTADWLSATTSIGDAGAILKQVSALGITL